MPNSKDHSRTPFDTTEKKETSKTLGYIKALGEQKKEDDLNLITAVEKQVQGVLSEVQYIAELLETNKKMAPVEDLRGKIKAAYKKIRSLLEPENAKPGMEQETNRRTRGGIQLEENPLIKEMGGLPLEVISPEWQDKVEGEILDKTELENLVNKKLKNRIELANKLKAQPKLRAQPKLGNQPKPGQQMTPKFKKIQETLKYIMKEMPSPPQPAPAPSRPRPTPYGY